MFDFHALPSKYMFNKESLSENKYVDDNSLFVYHSLWKGIFTATGPDTALGFLYYKPFEWTQRDFVSFLFSACKDYGLAISEIRTNFCAITEDYEVSLFDENNTPLPKYKKIVEDAMDQTEKDEMVILPKIYEGAYQRILDLKEAGEADEEIELFDRFNTDTATVADIERALIYGSRLAPLYDDTDPKAMSKEIFEKIIDWTTFSITLTPEQKHKLGSDLRVYMEAFIQDKLVRNSKTKRIGNTPVEQSENIYTFKKQGALFREYLLKMRDDFGNIVTIENTFEDRFPNLEYPDEEAIRSRYANRNFLFVHTLYAFVKQGLIGLFWLGNNWDYHEDKMLTYQAKIEILPAFLNEDLALKLAFDTDKSRFYVQGKEIKLSKFKDEYHTLRIMFEDRKELPKEWFFSEIAEKIDESNLDDKKYYNAIYQLRLKLEKQGIKDFFITTKQSVKIDQKYLS